MTVKDAGKYYDDEIFRYLKNSFGSDIYIGSSMQKFKVAMDTSTNLFIIPFVGCDYCENLSLYNPWESFTSKLTDSKNYTIQHASLYDHWVSNSLVGKFY